MIATFISRLRPTVLFLHFRMGVTVTICCTYFGPSTESIGIVGAYVASLLLSVGDLVKDKGTAAAPFRVNAAALALIADAVLI